MFIKTQDGNLINSRYIVRIYIAPDNADAYKATDVIAEMSNDASFDETLATFEFQNRERSESAAEDFIRRLIKRGHESVLEHVSLTFHIICDRAIQNELVRHRLASFSVESTRYVKYDELTLINPPPHHNFAENNYRDLIQQGYPPEFARAVLPLCLKSELYMTANLREWRHILKLRTDSKAHPQMRFVAGLILEIFKKITLSSSRIFRHDLSLLPARVHSSSRQSKILL